MNSLEKTVCYFDRKFVKLCREPAEFVKIILTLQVKHGMENGKETKSQLKFWLYANALPEFHEISMMNILN